MQLTAWYEIDDVEWMEIVLAGGYTRVFNNTILFFNHLDQLHRLSGPAEVYRAAGEAWRYNGQLHRTDGPARKMYDAPEEWWVNGIYTGAPTI